MKRRPLLVLALFGCGGTSTEPTPLELPPAGSAQTDPRSEAPRPPERALAFWQGASSRGVCWIGEGRKVICRLVDEDCALASELPAPSVETPAIELSSGYHHTCTLVGAGEVVCAGANHDAQLGSSEGHPPALAGPAAGVSGGFDHTCVALRSGSAQCWGDNSTGQLAVPAIPDDGRSPRWLAADRERTITLDRAIVQVAAGGGHSCALLEDGQVRCWGDDRGKKLGHEAVPPEPWKVPVRLAGPAASVETGTWATCAVLRDGRVQCWGFNDYGILCDADPKRSAPTLIPLPEPAVALALSDSKACAVLANGRVACWGGVCQARSCDLDATPAEGGRCTPEILPAGKGPARAVAVGDLGVCVLGGAEPACTCRRKP